MIIIAMAQVYYGHPLEKEMVSVVNLQPGENTKFLHLRIYFIHLEKHGNERYPSKDPLHPELPFIDDNDESCHWTIGSAYFEEAKAKADYAIVAICNTEKYSGIKSFILGHRDKSDPSGMHISLVCNSSVVDIDSEPVKLRIGQLLQLTLLNYAFTKFGMTYAYNNACSSTVAVQYGRNGWLPSSTNCGTPDVVADKFPTKYSLMKSYIDKKIEEKQIVPTNVGIRMKLCKRTFNDSFRELLHHTIDVMNELLERHPDLDINTLCDFA
jgi:hypothetical protein